MWPSTGSLSLLVLEGFSCQLKLWTKTGPLVLGKPLKVLGLLATSAKVRDRKEEFLLRLLFLDLHTLSLSKIKNLKVFWGGF